MTDNERTDYIVTASMPGHRLLLARDMTRGEAICAMVNVAAAYKKSGLNPIEHMETYATFRTPTGEMIGLWVHTHGDEQDAMIERQKERYEARMQEIYHGTEDGFDYLVTANMPTPTDSLFALRDGKDTVEVEVAHA